MNGNTIYTEELLKKLGVKDVTFEIQEQDNFTMVLLEGIRRNRAFRCMGASKYNPGDPIEKNGLGQKIAKARAIKNLCTQQLHLTPVQVREKLSAGKAA